MAKGSYTVVRKRRGKDKRFHAMLLHDPNGITMCGQDAAAYVVAETLDAVSCEDCAAMIEDGIMMARRKR